MSDQDNKNDMVLAEELTAIQNAIIVIRDMPVILANDLAKFYETEPKRINEYRARNKARFSDRYAFQLTMDEWKILKSQIATSRSRWGGQRSAPWAYTEHGVAMMSMGMKSEIAIRLSKIIIDTFVDFRRDTQPPIRILPGPSAHHYRRSLQEKLYRQIEQLMDVELPASSGQTVRDELGGIASKALGHMKAVLDAPIKKNEHISAEISKILAEAEKLYAETRKIHAEADTITLDYYRARLDFVRDLREMAQQLEHDDWLDVFDQSFGDAERAIIEIRKEEI